MKKSKFKLLLWAVTKVQRAKGQHHSKEEFKRPLKTLLLWLKYIKSFKSIMDSFAIKAFIRKNAVVLKNKNGNQNIRTNMKRDEYVVLLS
mmetsp:Transcript_5821/g.7994  ORF Transcript_5821/g.7994 Transcript_5821/m.7994 type:complete len:90 (-) Transcript_5821:48-317(-)